jgi:hypothetical protein
MKRLRVKRTTQWFSHDSTNTTKAKIQKQKSTKSKQANSLIQETAALLLITRWSVSWQLLQPHCKQMVVEGLGTVNLEKPDACKDFSELV